MTDANPLDVARVRAEAESWLKTYPAGAESVPSDVWPWLNGRCHPRIVLALCERIAELEMSSAALTFKGDTVILGSLGEVMERAAPDAMLPKDDAVSCQFHLEEGMAPLLVTSGGEWHGRIGHAREAEPLPHDGETDTLKGEKVMVERRETPEDVLRDEAWRPTETLAERHERLYGRPHPILDLPRRPL